jgi:hypothetical protein
MSVTQATFWKCGVAGTVNPSVSPRSRSLRPAVTGVAGRRGRLVRRKHRPLRQCSAAPRRDAGSAAFATAPFFGLALSAACLEKL